jgi:hypothetical protein
VKLYIREILRAERKAEWLGNNNRKTMIRVKTTTQILPFKNGIALPSPSQAPGCVPGTAHVLKSESNVSCSKSFDKS